MSASLTQAERETLNAAMEIIGRHTPAGASWSFDSARYRRNPDKHYFGVTYFDSNEDGSRGQHGSLGGPTWADKIEKGVQIEARAAELAESNRLKRLEALRAELAKLEQAA